MGERKFMYVLRGRDESHAAWSRRMRSEVSPRLLALRPAKLQLTVTESQPPKPSLFPFKREPIAIFNIYDDDAGDPSRFTEILRGAAPSVSGYEVEEAYPVTYEKTWRDGEPTPSPILLTMLCKKPGITTDEYIRRWHGGHTPLSLEVHPLWYYQRNVVRKPITEGAEPFDGIVLEACPTRGDLLNPARFFGGPLKMLPNMLRVANDIKGFLDMKKTENFYATEYHLRS
ncbi:MAG: hypothetical protein AMJ62_07120 [Myxococcales bacterium SG8_38]|nr:MAG: hypothetical protein AMJ62_07120 [Myxococcales bacterium SG8_38]